MKNKTYIFLILVVIFLASVNFVPYLNQNYNTIAHRFPVPQGFVRTQENPNSFANYLRNLKLKPQNSLVKYYNGTYKNKANVYVAVIDLPIGNKDLHQCADAVMRLRADYLYQKKDFNAIHFNFTNGFRVDFSEWIKGKRIVLQGNKTYWKKATVPAADQNVYWQYLEQIFQYAGTASLEKELKTIAVKDIQIGDVFIKGGFPGHAVIVVDKAINIQNNHTIFMLAQSYMPAQELQVLQNPNRANGSPWYDLDFGTTLETPEWRFDSSQLKRF